MALVPGYLPAAALD